MQKKNYQHVCVFTLNVSALFVCVCACVSSLLARATMTSTNNQYFIIIEKPKYLKRIEAGSICYTSSTTHKSTKKLPIYLLNALTPLSYDLELDLLRKLSEEEAELLQALRDNAERLIWSKDGDALQAALLLKVDTAVTVDHKGEKLQGIIRFVGRLSDSTFSCPLSGRFFGIELQVGF